MTSRQATASFEEVLEITENCRCLVSLVLLFESKSRPERIAVAALRHCFEPPPPAAKRAEAWNFRLAVVGGSGSSPAQAASPTRLGSIAPARPAGLQPPAGRAYCIPWYVMRWLDRPSSGRGRLTRSAPQGSGAREQTEGRRAVRCAVGKTCGLGQAHNAASPRQTGAGAGRAARPQARTDPPASALRNKPGHASHLGSRGRHASHGWLDSFACIFCTGQGGPAVLRVTAERRGAQGAVLDRSPEGDKFDQRPGTFAPDPGHPGLGPAG